MQQETFEFEDERTIDERFAEFHALHPEVFMEFRKLAQQLRDRGHQHYGAKGIFEVLRFHRAVDGRPEEPFKLNNIYTSRYVRMLIQDDPSFLGFFELRVLKSRGSG